MYRPANIQTALSDFESFFGDSVHSFERILAPVTGMLNNLQGNLPAVDIRETDSAYVLEMELPGFDEKNIDIHVDGSSLTIASKQTEEKKVEDTKENYLLRERRFNSFSRSFKLPENANPEEIAAEFKNGVLTMEIQKRAEAQKRAVKINAK